jgi:hypothetical protein
VNHRGCTIEPEGVGHELLLRWAPWARDDGDGRQSWNVKPRLESAYKGDPPEEFWLVEGVVAPHRRDRGDLWLLVSRFYLGEKAYDLIAKDLAKPEWWVRQMLCWCCETVRREVDDARAATPPRRSRIRSPR